MSKKKKPPFNRYEREIIKLSFGTGRPMSTKEIADKADMSWVTSRKYVNRLKRKNWLKAVQPKRVEFNYPRLGIKRRRKKK